MPRIVLIRLPEVLRQTGEKKTTWYRKMAAGKVPKPVPIGERGRAWVQDEIDQLNAARVAARDAEAGADIRAPHPTDNRILWK